MYRVNSIASMNYSNSVGSTAESLETSNSSSERQKRSHESEDVHLFPRKKTSKACTHCRDRKIRCDGKSPCGSCEKSSYICNYLEEPWETPIDATFVSNKLQQFNSKVAKLLTANVPSFDNVNLSCLGESDMLIGTNPACGIDEDVSLFDDMKSSNRKAHVFMQKPSIFFHLLRQDPGAIVFWQLNEQQKTVPAKLPQLFARLKPIDRKIFAQVLLQRDSLGSNFEALLGKIKEHLGDKYISFPNFEPDAPKVDLKTSLSKYGKSMGFYFSEDYDDGDTIFMSLVKLLPRKEIFDSLLDKFFAKLYPLFPVVDSSFRRSINSIFMFTDTGEFIKVVVQDKTELADVVSLLMILRLSYILVFRNSKLESPAEVDVNQQYLAENPIPVEIMEVADKCLNEVMANSHRSMNLLLALTLRYICKVHLPEEGVSPYSVEVSTLVGSMIQLAQTLSLHRDPDCITGNMSSELIQFRRTMWYFILQQDQFLALSLTFPMVLRAKSYDTKLPEINSQATSYLAFFDDLTSQMLGLVKGLSDINGKMSVSDILSEATEIELMVLDKLGTAEDYFKLGQYDKNDCMKVLKFQRYIQIKMFLAAVYQFLYIHYDLKDSVHLLYFFFKKMITIFFEELSPINQDLLLRSDQFFDESFTLITSPIISLYGHILGIVSFGIIIRIICTLKQYKVNQYSGPDSTMTLISSIHGLFEGHASRTVAIDSVIGGRYLFAWKCKKAHLYGYSQSKINKVYSKNDEYTKMACFKWSSSQLKDLQLTLTKFSQNRFFKQDDEGLRNYLKPIAEENVDSLSDKMLRSVNNDSFWVQVSSRYPDHEMLAPSFKQEIEFPVQSGQLSAFMDQISANNFGNLGQFADFDFGMSFIQ